MLLISGYLARKRMSKIAPYIKGDVLDIGCGYAQILKEYGHYITTYMGIERSKALVEGLSRQYPDAHFLQRDLDKDKLETGKQFDSILMIAVIEHLFNQQHIMDEVYMALKPGGIVVITTPTHFGNDLIHRAGVSAGLFAKLAVDEHIVIYNRHRFAILAKKIGFVLKHHEHFQFFCNQFAILAKP